MYFYYIYNSVMFQLHKEYEKLNLMLKNFNIKELT